MNWKANWIWDDSGKHPRNQWSCFRREFNAASDYDSSILSISADTKYWVYINGNLIGSGPVRGWTSEWHYDEYELTGLNKGENVISVLVNHYGMGTMQYIEGRAGVIAQIDFYREHLLVDQLVTDGSWKTAPHAGFIRETVKMSNCLPWSEIYNAGLFDEDWNQIDFDSSSWSNAIVIGSYGMEPWKELMPRDIPPLTNEPVFPDRVLAVKEVRAIPQHFSIDLKPTFFPDDLDNNAGKVMQGYVVTEILSDKEMDGNVSLIFDAHAGAKWEFKLNGMVYKTKNGQSEQVKLKKGGNLLVVDVSGYFHVPTVHLAFDFPENLQLVGPLGFTDNRFIVMGPFYTDTRLQIGFPEKKITLPHEDYAKMSNIITTEELEPFKSWAKPIPSENICMDNVSLLSVLKTVVTERAVPTQYQNMVLPNKSFSLVRPMENGDPEILIDLGKEWLGEIEFEVEASKGAIFDFFLFESIHRDGRVEHTFTLNNSLRYVARGGRQSYRSHVPRGFRFLLLTIRNLSEPCRIHSVKVNVTTFPTGNIGTFSSSDFLLNQIWEISKQTVRMCSQDTIIDCPAYEQALWTGDTYNSSLMNYYLFGNYDLVKRCLKLISRSIYRSPLPESHVPSGWQNVLTAWSILWMMACREYYRFSGDFNFIKEIYSELKLTVKRFESFINPCGLLEISAWNMLDWAPMDTYADIVTHQNALLVQALRDTSYLAGAIGENEDEAQFLASANHLKQAINKYLWNEEKRVYVDSIHEDGTQSEVQSLQTNLMVYLSGCAEGERIQILESYLLNPPAHFLEIKSPFVYFFYYKALSSLGRNDIVLHNIKDVYGFMLENDATTCWEGWELIEGDFSRSHCHAWSAAPAYVFGAAILGVTPLEPGFKKVRISPDLNGLTWVKGSVPIPNGKIDVYCRDSGDELDLQIHLPVEVEAQIVTAKKARIQINGKPSYLKDVIL